MHTFLYAVHRDRSCVALNETDGASRITTPVNDAASASGYSVDRPLFELAQGVLRRWGDVPNEDLGVTVLMLAFAKYCARGQYHLFVNDFKNVSEMQHVESYLNRCTNTYVKLPRDLAVDATYGIRANSCRFDGFRPLTMMGYTLAVATMASSKINPELFLALVGNYHINIVESFYMFASITRDSKTILECRELNRPTLGYVLDKFHREYRYGGEYWFTVPPKSVWFAYLKGK